MNNGDIARYFSNGYTSEEKFVEFVKPKVLRTFDISGIDDITEFNLCLVDGKYFWYRVLNGTVYSDEYGFLDEEG